MKMSKTCERWWTKEEMTAPAIAKPTHPQFAKFVISHAAEWDESSGWAEESVEEACIRGGGGIRLLLAKDRSTAMATATADQFKREKRKQEKLHVVRRILHS